MPAKILIIGRSNVGKTTLLKSLKNALVIADDGKPFSLPMAHVNIVEFEGINAFLDTVEEAVGKYANKFGQTPDTICFDSVSRIFTDIETFNSNKYKGFDVWSNVNKDVNAFCECINQLNANGFNVVLIAHCSYDEKTGNYSEVAKGSFAKLGGFISTVDEAVYLDMQGTKRIIHHRGSNMCRTLIDSLPDKEPVEQFNLQEYLNLLQQKADSIADQWRI